MVGSMKLIRRHRNHNGLPGHSQKGVLVKSESVSSQSEEEEETSYKLHITCLLILLLVATTIAALAIYFAKPSDVNNSHPNDFQSNNLTIDDSSLLGHHRLIYRNEWGGIPPLNHTHPLPTPAGYVIISHTAGTFCTEELECTTVVRTMQAYHMETLEYSDIGYNFLIGGDANIYVGRGWDVVNFWRDGSIDISFLGNFVHDKLTLNMVEAAKNLIQLGVKRQKLLPDYKLVCHDQTYATESPSENLYNEVKNWPHFHPGIVE